jgi:hypothetical protein
MKISPVAVMPTTCVAAVVVWACWSLVFPTDEPPPTKVKVVEIEAKHLSPDLGAPRKRNPFLLPGEVPPELRKAANGQKPESFVERMRRLIKQSVAKAEPPGDVKEARAREATAIKDAREAKAREVTLARTTLAGLKLAATSVHDGRGVAIIGGRAYAEGDTLEATDPTIGPVVLSEVRPGEVTLRSRSALVALRFPETSTPSTGVAPSKAAKGKKRTAKPGVAPSMKGKVR